MTDTLTTDQTAAYLAEHLLGFTSRHPNGDWVNPKALLQRPAKSFGATWQFFGECVEAMQEQPQHIQDRFQQILCVSIVLELTPEAGIKAMYAALKEQEK